MSDKMLEIEDWPHDRAVMLNTFETEIAELLEADEALAVLKRLPLLKEVSEVERDATINRQLRRVCDLLAVLVERGFTFSEACQILAESRADRNLREKQGASV